jgi:hypothetical protein
MKHLKFILPVLFFVFIFNNNSYSQLRQSASLDSALEDVKQLINLAEYDLALEKLQLSKKNLESAGDMFLKPSTNKLLPY